ncbi:hypothetical protein FSZ31_00845 [Sphingorhabdus soli]|uniref:META domain-containing protein n=1 Tax=Flavisphingopyxis soli TaxID=2601267 RepID=A0A5C6UML9_9SPHN|nr:hypothetical protein [Sphingorhabdus soli]TXC73346.1 hypothetical protein FSZ31_00845 [Sphingorhabdus soli]
MRARAFLVLSALVLVGCGSRDDRAAPQGVDRSANESAPQAQAKTLPPPDSLVGEWRVAGIDGNSLTGNIGIAVSIDENTIGYEPRCRGFVWNYRYARGEVGVTRAPPLNSPVDGVPAPVCLVAVPPELIALGKAFDAVEQAGRTPENGVLLSGGGHSVTLFSQ